MYIAFDATATVYADNATLVIGSSAQTYYPLHPAEEWERCQRYYSIAVAYWSALEQPFFYGYDAAAAAPGRHISHPVRMAVIPTMTKTGTWTASNCGQPDVIGAPQRVGYDLRVTVTALGSYSFYPDSTDDTITAEANP